MPILILKCSLISATLVLLCACSDDNAPADSSVDMTTSDLSQADSLPALPSGAIAWWQFDEGSGQAAQDSAGNHNGTLINGPTWVAGVSGQALQFDGEDDYVDIPDDAAFDFGTGDFSLSAWFKTTSAKDHHIINFRQDDNDPHIELYAAPLPFGYFGTHVLPGYVRISYTTAQVDNGEWHHGAVVMENGATDGYKLYLDGALVGTDTYSGPLEDWDTIHIGDGDPGSRAFDGVIDEVMVYDRALTEQEIQTLHQQGASAL